MIKLIDPTQMTPELERVQNQIIIEHRKLYGESPSPMKLQKLCYYVQGYYLALNEGKALFSEDFEAWTYGPVIPELYQKYKEYGYRGIDLKIEKKLEEESQEPLVEKIVESYGRYDGAALSTMTHREKPWVEASLTGKLNEIISKQSMQIYFKTLLQ